MLIMLTNTIEYDEWQTGERNDAITFSVRPFMVKLSSAVQYGVVAVTLVLCGMYSITQEIGTIEQNISTGLINKEVAVEVITHMLNTVTSSQMLGLTFAMTIIPIILFVVAYIIIKKKYIIDEAMYDKMIKEIESRKSEEHAKN
jgi:melibiose permease/lactose/raffinose/galactose permease